MIDENNLVVKQNRFVESIYDLSALEMKLTIIAISRITKEDAEFITTFISVEEFSKITHTNKSSAYEHIKGICINLSSKSLKIFSKDTEEFTIYPWFSKLRYSEGKVELEFNNKIKPFLLMLKDNFTQYKLRHVINMKSKYSIKLYELLKQYETIGSRKFTIEKFKEILNLKDGYSQWCNIKNRVLEPAKKELKIASDIQFTYQPIRTGRKITSIKFYIAPNEDEQDYNNYDKYKITGIIQDEFFNKFNINLHHVDFVSGVQPTYV